MRQVSIANELVLKASEESECAHLSTLLSGTTFLQWLTFLFFWAGPPAWPWSVWATCAITAGSCMSPAAAAKQRDRGHRRLTEFTQCLRATHPPAAEVAEPHAAYGLLPAQTGDCARQRSHRSCIAGSTVSRGMVKLWDLTIHHL